MLHKHKIERIGLNESVMRMIDHMEAVCRRTSPTLHKLLFKCDQNELVRCRRLLSIPFGIALGFFIYGGIIRNFPLTENVSISAKLTIVGTITLGYITSVQARCVLLLIMPTMLTGMMRTFFYALLFREIFLNVLVTKFMEILIKIAKTMFCYFSFRISLKVWTWHERIGPLGRRILEISSKNPFNLNLLDDKRAIAKLASEANGQVDTFYKMCRQQFDSVINKCTDIVDSSPIGYLPVFNTPFVGKWFTKQLCKSLIGWTIDDKLCDRMLLTFKKSLANMNASTSSLLEGAPTEAMRLKAPDVSEWDQAATWDDFKSFQDDLLGDFTAVLHLFRSVNILFQILTVILFFVGMLKANQYHSEYLSSLTFENHYIDRYFRHIDKRRKARGKEYLLPLRGVDRDELVPIFSIAKNKKERESKILNWALIIPILFFSIIFASLNVMLTEFCNYVAEELNFVYRIEIFNQFKPKFTNWNGGQNKITQMLNDLFGWVSYDGDTSKWEFDLGQCRQTVVPLHFMDYVSTCLRVLLLVAVLTFSTYLARSRKLICDYIYHRYSKERTLYLYNDRLRRRKQYLRQRKDQLKEAVLATKVFEKKFDMCYTEGHRKFSQTDSWFKKILLSLYDYWTDKCCFVCAKKIQMPYFDCDTKDCRLLYCEWCFADVGNRCLNCRRKQENERYAIFD